jgi:hypothetical protein
VKRAIRIALALILIVAAIVFVAVPLIRDGGAPTEKTPRSVAKVEAPPYAVDGRIDSGPQRTDWFVITDPSATDAELRAILIELNAKRSDAATTAAFFASKEKASKDEIFAYGEYAATEKGMSFLGLEGEPPAGRIER